MRKFTAQYIGSFIVESLVENVAYRIEIPSYVSKLQSTFHISKHKQSIANYDDSTTSNTQLITVDSSKEYEIENLVAQCDCGNN